jgi:recombination protein RecR
MIMDVHPLSSRTLEKAVEAFATLPGIGRRSALRLVLHLLKQDKSHAINLGHSIINLSENIIHCDECHNISDSSKCPICSNPKRDHTTVCVVESIRDVIAIEQTGQYQGVYHVLGGLISPMDGIGPGDLTIDSLIEKIRNHSIKEIILALSTTIEGDTTNFYIFKKIHSFNIHVTLLARGVSIGDEIEYADEVTLGRSIINRTPYEESVKNTL